MPATETAIEPIANDASAALDPKLPAILPPTSDAWIRHNRDYCSSADGQRYLRQIYVRQLQLDGIDDPDEAPVLGPIDQDFGSCMLATKLILLNAVRAFGDPVTVVETLQALYPRGRSSSRVEPTTVVDGTLRGVMRIAGASADRSFRRQPLAGRLRFGALGPDRATREVFRDGVLVSHLSVEPVREHRWEFEPAVRRPLTWALGLAMTADCIAPLLDTLRAHLGDRVTRQRWILEHVEPTALRVGALYATFWRNLGDPTNIGHWFASLFLGRLPGERAASVCWLDPNKESATGTSVIDANYKTFLRLVKR